ncbi:MAG TPA: MFS transporter [Jatrophihabitans sp.]|nr:MFS transporter [Jatrophihabitans sp.]
MDQETTHQRRWAILGVLVLCLLVVILDNTILNVALKTIQNDLEASQSEMQWAVDSYLLVFAGLLITWGVLGDRLGRKRILVTCMVLFGAMSAVCSFADSSGQLIAFRALMGIGAAAVQPQTLSIIQNVFEPRERAKAIGIWAGASGVAIALGPVTGGLLLKYFWWGSIFLVNVPIVIAALAGIVILVPESKNPAPGRLDPFGVLLSIVALVVLVYGVIEGGNRNDWLAWNSLGAIVLGAALLGIFVWTQARSAHPTIDVSLFRNRQFSSGAFAIAMTFFALQGSTFYLAYYMQAIRGYSPLLAGTALVAVAGAVMMSAPLSAKLSAKFGSRVVTGAGLMIFGLALASYSLATQTMPVWVIELVLVGFGLGMGLTMTPATDAIMSAVPREKSGAGSAVNNTVRQVAGALGVAILGSIVAVVFRNHLGSSTPADVAARLDRPAAVVAQLPSSERVTPLVTNDTSQSIGNALTFAGQAGGALQARAGSVPPAQAAQQAPRARTELPGFVASSKSSFMSAMRVTSLFAALAAILGALVAFRFLPARRAEEPMVPQAADVPAKAVA